MTGIRLKLSRDDLLAIGTVLAVLVALTIHWAPRTFWSPDALFYQTRVEQIQGASQEEALARVWEGPLAAGFRTGDARLAPERQALADPRWLPFHYELFDRRLSVPLLAAAIDPVAETESLEVVAIVGVFAFALALYALLRRRFNPLAAAIAVNLCLVWPPVFWAFMPLTESWGLALVCVALLAALMVIERGGNWLWVWGAVIVALSFTRDFTPVVLGAAALVLVTFRDRRSLELLGVGLLAALPAPLVGGTPLREHLAFSFNDSRIPEDSSWGFVADRYLGELEEGIRGNFDYLFAADPRFLGDALPLLPLAVPIVAGVILVLLARAPSRDGFLPLMRGALLGGLAYYLLLPHFNYLRYELVFLPVAAAGIAIAVDLSRRARAGASDPAGG